ncbi:MULTISPECIES: DUF6527 family protein [Lelliottia]|uniref:Uncharacterized protein n=2 Tax=Lelliottia aquatilis TaxID=2080838 RepID=A0ABX5A0P3_9ENTR|nr:MULTISPECIES: DUF6527 family protein [Lelliottia]POZ17736.1 hypothetical protein C3708_17900 [Lelliottia sp. 7254-16]POZ21342.1 hypothetical protein C3712_16295 [Lelliottia aquatilis]POZ23268.1 hypothetical protein C3711_17040 [Lelliottia aquatilis]POZ31453.1 hypothetical protein C3710_17225 [Lelliottia aquatilis]POZ37145.1 hypothetical protein C3709_16620 [Lelliottia aquatilis]
MIRHNQLTPCFVKGVPRILEPGILYVSMEYGTVVHSCCCGCGLEVVTPLTPTDWRLTFDGEAISLWPSVGNWNLPCRSHYVIQGNRVVEAGQWDKAQIDAERRRDKAAKARYYSQIESPGAQKELKPKPTNGPAGTTANRETIWAKLLRWLS